MLFRSDGEESHFEVAEVSSEMKPMDYVELAPKAQLTRILLCVVFVGNRLVFQGDIIQYCFRSIDERSRRTLSFLSPVSAKDLFLFSIQ